MNSIKFVFILIALSINADSYSQIHSLPTLKYPYNALEPFVDSITMEIHYTKHHQAYVTNLNKAVKGTISENTPIIDLLLNISSQPEIVRNNAGGHYNHSLFWDILTPVKETKPSEELLKVINESYTSLDSLKKLINKAASTRFGSGWAWLIVTPDKKLAVCSSANQDNPLMDISTVRGIPIIGIDVWEHAYYLKYQNKRGDYLGAIWNIIDWDVVSKKYLDALNNPFLEKMK